MALWDDDLDLSISTDDKKEYEVIPVGQYKATLDNVELAEWKDTPQVKLTYKITEGEFEGRILFQTLWMQDFKDKSDGIKKATLITYNNLGIKDVIKPAKDWQDAAVLAQSSLATRLGEGFLMSVYSHYKANSGKVYANTSCLGPIKIDAAVNNPSLKLDVGDELPF